MQYDYEDFDDKSLRSRFPAIKTMFDDNYDSTTEKLTLEVTDIRGDILEIQLENQTYLSFSLSAFKKCIEAHRHDYQ